MVKAFIWAVTHPVGIVDTILCIAACVMSLRKARADKQNDAVAWVGVGHALMLFSISMAAALIALARDGDIPAIMLVITCIHAVFYVLHVALYRIMTPPHLRGRFRIFSVFDADDR